VDDVKCFHIMQIKPVGQRTVIKDDVMFRPVRQVAAPGPKLLSTIADWGSYGSSAYRTPSTEAKPL